MKTILLPTDFKKHSENALQFAIKIAQETHAKIIVSHAYLIPFSNLTVPACISSDVWEEESTIIENELNYYEKQISEYFYSDGTPVQSESVAEQDMPAYEIVHLIREKNVDLVVMGLEDENHLFKFLTSTAVQVINNIQCPVLLVQEKSKLADFRSIFFAVENMQEDLPKIGQLIPLAKVFGAEVSVFHIDKSPEGIDDLTNLWTERRHYDFLLNEIKLQYNYPNINYSNYLSDELLDTIEDSIKKEHPNLLALVHKKRNWKQVIFHKSVIHQLIKNANIPLFIIH